MTIDFACREFYFALYLPCIFEHFFFHAGIGDEKPATRSHESTRDLQIMSLDFFRACAPCVLGGHGGHSALLWQEQV